jgi:Fe-S cluster biosynthesis and repair protein YggX
VSPSPASSVCRFPALLVNASSNICQDCWALVATTNVLINHYGLNVMDPQARSFLKQNMQAFLFKAGAEEDVNHEKGTIQW